MLTLLFSGLVLQVVVLYVLLILRYRSHNTFMFLYLVYKAMLSCCYIWRYKLWVESNDLLIAWNI